MELMAPVGSWETLQVALDAGCDSVYFGVPELNLRARSSASFALEDLPAVVRLCEARRVKSYLTLNTIVYDHELELMGTILDAARASGISAVICADMAALTRAREVGVPVHVSTQLSVSNLEAVRYYARHAEAIVLARELTLPMVAAIVEGIRREDLRGPAGELVRIEVFGHGALCVAASGRCGMSLLTDGTSGNRGTCGQTCRREYVVTDPETGTSLRLGNHFVMSSEDLCTLGLLPEVVATGASILKIEGRGRSADYVDRVTRTYAEALRSVEDGSYSPERAREWIEGLRTVFNRGLGTGHYLGRTFREWSGVDGSRATRRREFVGRVEKYFSKLSVVQLTVQDAELRAEDDYLVVGKTTGLLRGSRPELRCDEGPLERARRGQQVTFRVERRVRQGDRVFRLVDQPPRP